MSAPVDELEVGREPRARPPWHRWSPRRRRWVAAAAVVIVVGVGFAGYELRRPDDPPAVATDDAAARDRAPGADIVQDVDPDTTKCPPGRQCRYAAQVQPGVETAFRSAFLSAGYIGRQTVVDAVSGDVYWEYLHFTTGTLVTVTLTVQPVAQLATPPVPDDTPDDLERKYGSLTLSAVRDGYLVTAAAAALPGQTLPVTASQQWVHTVPTP